MMQFIKPTIVLLHTLYCSTTLEVGSTRSTSNNVVPQVATSLQSRLYFDYESKIHKLGRNG